MAALGNHLDALLAALFASLLVALLAAALLVPFGLLVLLVLRRGQPYAVQVENVADHVVDK